MNRAACVGAVLMLSSLPAVASTSVYRTAPDEPRAITVHGRADGHADDTAAIQSALDQAAEDKAGGIVFLPTGRYRISRTLTLWPGVRLFGTGAVRPVIVLGDRTPGFQHGVSNMLVFAGARRGQLPRVPFPVPGSVPFDASIADANSGTFYSALSNVDIAIGRGNPAAAAIRFHAAQHAFVSHMDFDLGSGLAGLYQVGNIGQDLHFRGGRYGILAEKTSPAWQFTLLDSTFEGQREAAIREHEAGLTLVNVAFTDMPVGVSIDEGYSDSLWGKDVRFERVRHAGIVISNEKSAFTQIGFENAVARDTPVFARFRDSDRAVAGPGSVYRVGAFNYGLAVPAIGRTGRIALEMKADPIPAMPPPPAPAIRTLPDTADWANVRWLGARGDDHADDTAVLQQAIDTHRVVYLPIGHYVVSDTLKLRPDTVLVALHPGLTWISLGDGTPGYQGVGPAKALIASAAGGDAILSGLGLFTGGINPRATALLWQAGANSLVEDVKLQGGHGTDLSDGTRLDPYNADHSGDPDPGRRWDAQYPSLWVANGGGGSFVNIWSPSTYARAGFYVSDTETPGHVYELSNEHHVRTEIALDHVANWEFLAPQTEEEAGEGQNTVSFRIQDARNILIANYHAYRVTRSVRPAASAVELYGFNEIRFRNVHVNAESGFASCDADGCATYLRASKYPFEDTIRDRSHGDIAVREHEFGRLDIGGDPVPVQPAGKVERLADGFYSISGAALDGTGGLFFVDHRMQRIYRWREGSGLSIVSENALDAVNLAVDRSGKLLVLSSEGAEGTAYSLDPARPNAPPTVIAATPARPHPDATYAIPGNWWVNGEFRDQLDPATLRFATLAELFASDVRGARARDYVSPDGSLVLPAYRTFQQGPADFRGWRFSHALDTYGFLRGRVGSRVFVSNGSEDRTYSARLGIGGALTDLQPFAERGGESVAVAPDGRVYVANGQVFVYAANGDEAGRIDVPDRPLQLLIGENGTSLFILTHHALYRARIGS